jgi:hypothetical protein
MHEFMNARMREWKNKKIRNKPACRRQGITNEKVFEQPVTNDQ